MPFRGKEASRHARAKLEGPNTTFFSAPNQPIARVIEPLSIDAAPSTRWCVLVLVLVSLAACAPITGSRAPEPSQAPVASSALDPTSTTAPTPAAADVATPVPTAAAATMTPAPTPETLTVEQAAKAYAALARTFNKAQRAADKLVPGPDTSDPNLTTTTWPLAANRKVWSAYLPAVDRFIAGYRAIEFPPAAAKDARALLKAALVYRKLALAASKVKSRGDTWAAYVQASLAYTRATLQAAPLRHVLELPPPHKQKWAIAPDSF